MHKSNNDRKADHNGDKVEQEEHGTIEELAMSDDEVSGTTTSDEDLAKSTVAEPSESVRDEDEEELYNSDNSLRDDARGQQISDTEGKVVGNATALDQNDTIRRAPDGEMQEEEDVPESGYPEFQYYQHLEEELLPNSSIPLELSNGESLELCSGPIFDEELFVKAGQPGTRIRGCRSPDMSRVVMMWKVYEDLDKEYPYQSSWDDPPEPQSSWPYAIAPIPGKGNGMLAIRDIECGETVLIERPLLLLPTQANSWEEMQSDLEVMVDHLDRKDQETVKSLCNSHPASQCEELTGLIFTNVMKCTFPQSMFATSYSGLCIDGCRANHR